MKRILVISDTGEVIRKNSVNGSFSRKEYQVTYISWSTKETHLTKKWDCIVILVDSLKRAERLCGALRTPTSRHKDTPLVYRGFEAMHYSNLSVSYTDQHVLISVDSVLKTKNK